MAGKLGDEFDMGCRPRQNGLVHLDHVGAGQGDQRIQARLLLIAAFERYDDTHRLNLFEYVMVQTIGGGTAREQARPVDARANPTEKKRQATR